MKIKRIIIATIIILSVSTYLFATDIDKNILKENVITKNETENVSKTEEDKKNTTNAISTKKDTNVIKSSNTNLKSLTIDADGLEPKFDKNITDYYLIVDLNTKKINVKATTEDVKSKTKITGNSNLNKGENKISIEVTAENGDTKTYVINVTRTDSIEDSNANLKNIEIQEFSISPEFKNNIYMYNLNINKNLSYLEIQAEAENENASVEIAGNDNLKEGDNLIKITVTAKDNETKKTYKINAFISSKDVIVREEDKKPAFIILGVLTVFIIGISISLIRKK